MDGVSDKDRGWKKLAAAVKKNAAGAHVVIGLLSDGKKRKEGDPLTNAQIGAVHEFGSSDGHVPERSFIRATIDANPEKYRTFIKKLALAVLLGEMTEAEALKRIGGMVEGDVRKRINANIPPELSEKTKEQKVVNGHSGNTALVNTGQMKSAITFQVRAGAKAETK